MRAKKTARCWTAKHPTRATFAAESLEWRNGAFWLHYIDRPPGEWVEHKDIGLWEFVPTPAEGRLRRRKMSAAEGLRWLLVQGYSLTAEPGEFVEEVLAQLHHTGAR